MYFRLKRNRSLARQIGHRFLLLFFFLLFFSLVYLDITQKSFDRHPFIRSPINNKNKAQLTFIFTRWNSIEIYIYIYKTTTTRFINRNYLGTWVKYEINLLYFSCVNSAWKWSGKVKIGRLLFVPPVTNANFSRNKSAIGEIFNEVSPEILSNKNKKY